MRTAIFLSLLLASAYEVSAIENTSPFLAWSPQEFTVNKDLNAQVISVQDLQTGVFDLVDCSHKAILVVDEPELHVSDLGQKGRERLKEQVHGAVSSLQIPFVDGAVDLENLAEQLARKCHTSFINANPVEDITSLVNGPSVIYKTLSSASVTEKDHTLESLIKAIRNKFQDNFLVLYSSSQTTNFSTKHRLSARQLPDEPAKKQTGVFHQYTFFSQGIFMGLVIVVIVVPIAFIGIFWNLSVQGPERFEKKQN